MVELYRGIYRAGRGPQNPKYDLIIPNLAHFLIQIILRGDMEHLNISPTAPSYSIHILTYMNKHAGECICTLGFEKMKVWKTNPSRLTEYTEHNYFNLPVRCK